eukprot:262428-Hanusia_phi.AAC.1
MQDISFVGALKSQQLLARKEETSEETSGGDASALVASKGALAMLADCSFHHIAGVAAVLSDCSFLSLLSCKVRPELLLPSLPPRPLSSPVLLLGSSSTSLNLPPSRTPSLLSYPLAPLTGRQVRNSDKEGAATVLRRKNSVRRGYGGGDNKRGVGGENKDGGESEGGEGEEKERTNRSRLVFDEENSGASLRAALYPHSTPTDHER